MQRRRAHLVRFGWAFLALQVGVAGARAGQLPPPPPPPPPPPTMSTTGPLAEMQKGAGFVLGQVLDAGTGQPVPGAIVSITGFGALPGGVPGGAQAVAPVTSDMLRATAPRRIITDRSGRFFFRELAGGRFGITVTAAGYMPGGYLQKKPGGTPHFLDLAQDEKRGDVQIQLWKFASMTGTVLDEAGEPAVGVMVRAFRRTMAGGRLRLGVSSAATTDDRGMYRLANLSPGDYLVGINATQSTIPAGLSELFLEAPVLDTPPPAVLSLQSSGVTPVTAGFRIGDLILQAASNRSGYVAPQPGDDGGVLSYLTTFFPGAPAPGQATVITLGSGEERTGLDLPLKLVRTVRVSGVVVDPAGPAGNIGLRLLPASTDEFATDAGIEVATAATDASGAFTFLGVPAGQYTLRVLKTPRAGPFFFNSAAPDGFVAAFESEAARARATAAGPPAPTLWASLPVTVDTTDVVDVSVTLKPGLRVSGRVEFAGTKPAPTAQELERGVVTPTPLSWRPAIAPAQARMGADLQFTTVGYPPGKYLMTASIPVAGWTLLSIKQGSRDVADEPLELETADASGLVITFTDQATDLSGTVVDAKGAPHPTAEIIAFPADSDTWKQGAFGPRRVRLTPGTKSGTYAVPGLPPGQYFIAAVDESATAEWQDPRFLERLQRSATRVTLQAGEKKTQALTLVVVR